MKFLEGDGKSLQSKLKDYPWSEAFSPAKILVVGISEDNDTAAACGIRSMLNILTLYVSRRHRRRGIGNRILRKTIDAAKKRGLRFILLGAYLDNPLAYHLYSASGFKEIVQIKRPDMRFMMLPLSTSGELACAFLSGACSWIPQSLLSGFAQWFEARTVSSGVD